jgi:transposase
MQITTIGLDIAKNVFQVHGIDAAEKVVVRKQLRRGQVLAFLRALPRCLIGIEACATSHCWARDSRSLATRCG